MDKKILYLEPEEEARKEMRYTLKEKGYDIELASATSTEDAKERLRDQDFDVLITEYDLPENEADDIIDFVHDEGIDTVTVIFSDKTFDEMSEEAIVSSHAYHEKDGDEAFGEVLDSMNYLMRDRSQVKRPKPENEDSRLKAIEKYDVEKMMEEEKFDRFTRIGAELFDAKFCFVGIVGKEQEDFMSFIGDDTEHLKRDCTICTFTINQDNVMEVEDTSKDPRFKYIDELHDLGIKWYAGAPLVTEEGYKIGSFCVADPEKKEFTERERELLQLFADEAMEKVEIEYRKKGLINKLKSLIG